MKDVRRVAALRFAAFCIAICLLWLGSTGAADRMPAPIAPLGARFPLILYAVDPRDLPNLKAIWTAVHNYKYDLGFAAAARTAGFFVLPRLPGTSGGLTPSRRAAVRASAADAPVAWWDLPEERRWWNEGERRIIEEYVAETRRADPARRPNYMYIPGHYSVQAVKKWIPLLDVVPASIYPHHQAKPHAWVRWRMESILSAIESSGFTAGADYQAGEKWPVAILELFGQTKPAVGCEHDFWQAVASGARGILIYGHVYRRATLALAQCWRQYEKAASLLGSDPGIQGVISMAKWRNAHVTIVQGPLRGPFFDIDSPPVVTSFPSVRAVQAAWAESRFLLVVNSATEPTTSLVRRDYCSGETRTLVGREISGNELSRVELPALGVHFSKIRCRG